MSQKPLYIDLFAGCGGLSLGLHEAGWKGLFAVEKSPDAFATLRHNLIDKKDHFEWVDWLGEPREHDINEVLGRHEEDLKKLQGKVSLVAGGPPCQGFSLAGRRNENDFRNSLVNSYIRFIELVRPQILFFENVTGFTISFKPKRTEVDQDQVSLFPKEEKEQSPVYSKLVLEKLKSLGYADVRGELLDFSDFGIPQSRKRFILIGTLNGKANEFFELLQQKKNSFLGKKGLTTKTSLEEAISDLLQAHGDAPSPDTGGFKAGKYGKATSAYQKALRVPEHREGGIADSHRFVNHTDRIVKRFSFAIENKLGPAEYKKQFNLRKCSTKLLKANECTPTLTTLPDDYIHYCEPRILTVREFARIQSFPDWFEFRGKYTTGGELRVKEVPRYTQIGNAIPPLFGELAGSVLKSMINNE